MSGDSAPRRRATESHRGAARENGKLGGRPPNRESLRELRRRTGGEALVRAVNAGAFLERVMLGDMTDREGNPMDVPPELRVRAASQLYAKGLPDQTLIGALDDVPVKLVEVTGYRGQYGALHTVEGVPGPESVQ